MSTRLLAGGRKRSTQRSRVWICQRRPTRRSVRIPAGLRSGIWPGGAVHRVPRGVGGIRRERWEELYVDECDFVREDRWELPGQSG
jgi:hypothetical protein